VCARRHDSASTRVSLSTLCFAALRRAPAAASDVNKEHVTDEALLEVAAANAGALRELCVTEAFNALGFTPVQAEALCGAAPQLDVFATYLYCDSVSVEAARRALRNEAPFGPLRVAYLNTDLRAEDEAGIVAFAADAAAHASLERLTLRDALLSTPAALDAVVDAALALRVQRVKLDNCHLSPASAPGLARLLSSGALTTLEVAFPARLLDAPAAAVLAAALRANATLTSLTLFHVGVFGNVAAAGVLLDALTGHASLRVLNLGYNRVVAAEQAAAGATLGALIAANAPALTQLDVPGCDLGDDGMRALFEALPQNTHLRTLMCAHNVISLPFSRDVLLPAVRANASLRQLDAGIERVTVRDAAQLVRGRA
jgi:hypothetical protein